MTEPHLDEEPPVLEPAKAAAEPGQVETMDDEEKILAGRADVNMTALLTKDVRGG